MIISRTSGSPDSSRNAPSTRLWSTRREQPLGLVRRARGLDQDPVVLLAGHVADPGDDQVGERIGEEAGVLVEDQEPERRGSPTSAARAR